MRYDEKTTTHEIPESSILPAYVLSILRIASQKTTCWYRLVVIFDVSRAEDLDPVAETNLEYLFRLKNILSSE
jgi:hypothetical protein